jgi:3D (Asp-Asp-Asp) domain-containing protein
VRPFRSDIRAAILAALAPTLACGANEELVVSAQPRPLLAEVPAIERPAPDPRGLPDAAAGLEEPEELDPVGSFELTYYWIAAEGRGQRTTPLYGRDCRTIAKVSESFARRVAMEGTGRLRDGRIVNVAGPCDCPSSRCFYFPSKRKRWGAGVARRPLSPFRSVAVDPDMVSIGDTIYIEELDGLIMPGEPPYGGFVHDGCVVADDRGGGVRGKKIDFFTGRHGYYRALFDRHGLTEVTVYPGDGRCLEEPAEERRETRSAARSDS